MRFRLLIASVVLISFPAISRAVSPISVTVEDPTIDPHVGGCGLLLREFVRQGILISARDELGLPTRDAALREDTDAAKSIAPHTLATDKFHIKLDLPGAPNAWQRDLDVKLDADHDVLEFLPVLAECEKLSRGEWVDLVKKTTTAGLSPKWTDAAAPENTEKLLANFNIVSQYAAVRLAHSAIAESGTSPARLATLIRGYAHLGRLTELHWSLSSKVFKARSLLYAQRLVAHNPDSALALYYRAYALAWAGMHGAALEDLDRADALRKKSNDAAPAWTEAIRAFCRQDVGALTDQLNKDKSLASLLSFFAVECATRDLNVIYARAALSANPECLRIIDSVNASAEVAEQHRSTLLAFGILPITLTGHLPEVPGLPAATKTALAAPLTNDKGPNSVAIAAVINSIAAPNDVSEPSLMVLHNLLGDTAFIMVDNRGEFMHWMWAVDATEFMEWARPLVESHPLLGVADSYDNNRSPAGLSRIDFSFSGTGVYNFAAHSYTSDDSIGAHALHALYRHTDNVAFDQEFVIERNRVPDQADYTKRHARQLLAVCPYSGVARSVMIEYCWDEVKDKAAEWEQTDHPLVLASLGRHYHSTGEYKKADPFLTKCVEKSTDLETYTLLADNALAQGDEAHWLAVMNQFLTRGEPGLIADQARLQIARHYMNKGDFATARPYCDAAAESGAGWALTAAAECAEGAGDYAAAEKYLVANAERYDDIFSWYFWCRRTGHGDIESARRAVELRAGTQSHDVLSRFFVYYIAEGRATSAKRALKEIVPDRDPMENLHLALLADADNNADMRDACLDRAADEPHYWRSRQPRGEIASVANLFRRALKSNPPKLDLSLFDDLMISLNEPRRDQLSYFIGRFLEIHHLPKADDYLRRAASTPSLNLYTRLLAAEDLRSRGISMPATRPIAQK
jgi:hypothetical protein